MPVNLVLSSELDHALAMEEYHRLKLMYWKHKRRELEQQIDSESQLIINELEQIASGAWDNGDSRETSTN